MSQIHFNGKTYNDIAEMPATEREAYEQLQEIFKDADMDGTPDIFQGDVAKNIMEAVTTNPFLNEMEARKFEQMSSEKRALIIKGFSMLKELGIISNVPDLSESHLNELETQEQASAWDDAEIHPSKPIISSPSAIQEDTGPRMGMILAVLIAVLLFGVGVAVVLLMSS